jgi:hypothetical protein
MRAALLMALLLCAAPLAAELSQHPFAKNEASSGPGLPLGLQWGQTTLSYSHAWLGAGSVSQGLLTKSLYAPLGGGLEFQASFGLQFTPMSSFAEGEQQPQWVLPYAALNWQPNDHFQLRLEYSQPGTGWGHGDSFHDYGLPFASRRARRESTLAAPEQSP